MVIPWGLYDVHDDDHTRSCLEQIHIRAEALDYLQGRNHKDDPHMDDSRSKITSPHFWTIQLSYHYLDNVSLWLHLSHPHFFPNRPTQPPIANFILLVEAIGIPTKLFIREYWQFIYLNPTESIYFHVLSLVFIETTRKTIPKSFSLVHIKL